MDAALQLRALTTRTELEAGRLRGAALLELLLSIPFADRDVWVEALLGFEEPPPDVADLPRGAVPYLPCGVEEILAMIRQVPVRAGDTLVDLGSGLGKVAILTHLLTGAHTSGIELQAPLVRLAKERCAALGLTGVSFLLADVAASELEGSIFFLYAPFNGELLKRVVQRLEAVARRHAIVICAVGLELNEVPWLKARSSDCVSLAIYESIGPVRLSAPA